MFASKVQRQSENVVNHRNKSLSNAIKGVKSAYAIVQSGSTQAVGQRPHTTVGGGFYTDVDIFEDEDDEAMPGPGAYYNPKQQTSFKTGKIPERLQFFGSTVERFNENKAGP